MLEMVNQACFERNKDETLRILSGIEDYHYNMIEGLTEMDGSIMERLKDAVKSLIDEVIHFTDISKNHDFDYCYGQLVSLGELLSSTIVNGYVNSIVRTSELVDARSFITTDSLFREASVYFDET